MKNDTITAELAAVRTKINHLLAEHFAERQRQADRLSPDYARLWQTIAHTSRDGKRLRPYMTYLSHGICGGLDEALALRVGTAIELLHVCLLTHDDIIDRDFIRHGRPNVAGTYRRYYDNDLLAQSEIDHYAASTALLAGDLLLSDAYQYLLSAPIPLPLRDHAAQLLQTAVFTAAGGELIDTEAPLLPVSLANSLAAAEYKTAYYSFAVPLEMGAMLAGANDETCRQFAEAGRLLGIAYQLADDLLGVFGDEEQTGKSNIGDLREGKRTFLLKKAYELAGDQQRQRMDDILLHERHDGAALREVKRIIAESGAYEATAALIDRHFTAAKAVTAQIGYEYPLAGRLDEFIGTLAGRDH